MNRITRVVVVLKLPKSVKGIISYTKTILLSMDNNANFPNAGDKLAKLQTDLTELSNRDAGMAQKPPKYTSVDRDLALVTVKIDLEDLRKLVQDAADANPAQAESIALSSGMSVRKLPVRSPSQNKAVDGKPLGTVILTAESGGGHQWQQSPDAGATTIDLGPTTGGSTIVRGLIPGIQVWFRNRQVLPRGEYGDWCQWVDIVPTTKE